MYVIRKAQEHHRNVELHLCKRVCPSVRPSVHPSIRRSVGPLRLLISVGFGVLWSTAWPVLALVLRS